MAEIVCFECKATVSDLSGYCPECGYPFDATGLAQAADVADNTDSTDKMRQAAVDVGEQDMVSQALDLLRSEVAGLSAAVADIRHSCDTQAAKSAENTQKLLSQVNGKLDAIISANAAREKEAQAASQAKQSAPSPKNTGSPGGMVEYTFYMCVVQIVFVIVNLFLAAYIAMLLRE